METHKHTHTQCRRIRLVLSTNKKSVPFHASEWPFFRCWGFLYVRVCLDSFFAGVRTIALIQGGFFSAAPKTDSGQDNGAKSVTKTCNHVIDSSRECPFFHQSIIWYALKLQLGGPVSSHLNYK